LAFEGHPENYSYPWRDNYCEARLGPDSAPLCPTKVGHAGQDIRPASCTAPPTDKARCKIDIFDVVAVTDGWAWWRTDRYENNLRLMIDDGANSLYFMYLHMSPTALRQAGMKRGKCVRVKKGQVIGKVGNFDKALAGGTSTHLHFEIRVGNQIGVTRPPYMTLVFAYERLIGERGIEIP
jgi:hypothetical protein